MDVIRQEHDGASQNGSSLHTKLGSEFLKTALFILFVIIPIRFFVITPFIVNGSSMHPTFENNDYLIVDQLSLKFQTPDRYEVVVFKYPYNTSKYFIKRVIGLPGERIVIENGTVTVYNKENPQGLSVPPPYADSVTDGSLEMNLKDNEYFVLGDNRGASSDSRMWGPLERSYIVGKPLVRLFPVKHAGVSPGGVEEVEESQESE